VNLRRVLVSLLAAATLLPAISHAEAPGRDAFARGKAALEQGDDAAARAAFEEAVAASRGWLLPRLELAELAVRRRERVAEERAALLEAAGPDSDVPRVHRLLAELAELAGDDEAAARSWSEAIERMPRDVEMRQRRAAVLFRLGRHAEAAEDWDRVVRARPDEPHLRLLLADALESAGRADEARAHLETAIRLQPGKETPVRRLARFLERRGETGEAKVWHAKADALRDRPPAPQRNLRPLLPSRR